MAHKAGFVNILGNPNVGKSTLMNLLVGERISIITSKSQTTRHRIKGIVNTDDYQIIFSDTPGVIQPNYKLQESMRNFSESALQDADVVVLVTDVVEKVGKNRDFIDKIAKQSAPVLLIINKIDLSSQDKVVELQEQWKKMIPQAEIFFTSALHKFNVEGLMDRIVELLPEGPPYFPKDELTDLPARFFVTEIIREKILEEFDKEIPYAVEVLVEEFHDTEKIINIRAVIHVERESQKPIIIGKGGSAIKRVGTNARKDIEAFFGKKVFLELFVKVLKDWRKNDRHLKNFGYKQ
ncbi:GTP-binding protein Era [Balneicella halophila]|uniref:GTPase Era n=1 Tax=Balneicella halophila TaxID=1537566 RepID=A0A7L4URC0_BALHA|nr:GTPase Era [Balneicella halophila]PVX51777.1 GTP-binding protein Era [Balneicella halophila]